MADAVLTPSGGLFPSGTSVSAYYPWHKHLGSAPGGTPLTTATVSDQGTLTFTGLLAGTLYTAYGVVGAVHRYIDFETEEAPPSSEPADLSPVYVEMAQLAERISVLEGSGVTYPDASTSTKGSTKLSASPVDAANPIAVADNDSRITAVTGLQDAVDALEASTPTAQTLGADIVATGSFAGSGGHSFMVAGSAPFRAKALRIRMRFQGNGSGGAGTQTARGVVYDGAGVPGLATAALIASGTQVTLTNPTSSQMVEFPLPADTIVEGTFSYGIHLNNAPVNQAMNIPYVDAAANSTLINNDTYADGSATTFGTLTGGYSWLPGIEIDIEPASAPDLTEDLEALDARVDTAETDIDALEAAVDAIGDGGGGGTTEPPTVEFATLDADEEWVTNPIIELGDEGGAIIVSTLSADTTEIVIEELDGDGVTWIPGPTVNGAADERASAVLATPNDAVRAKVTNTGAGTEVVQIVTARVA